VLFKGTVFDNVAKGFADFQRSLSIDDQMELVREACKSSNAHDFIQQLPKVRDIYSNIDSPNLLL